MSNLEQRRAEMNLSSGFTSVETRLSDEEVGLLIDMWPTSISCKRMSDILKTPITTLYDLARRLGLPTSREVARARATEDYLKIIGRA